MRARAGRLGDGAVVVFEGATTRSSAFRPEALKAFRRDLKDRGPNYENFEARIWIEGYRRGRRLDADNVAKACLDALTGLIWRDDRQVTRLVVEKLAGGGERIVVAARPTSLAEASDDLASVLAAAGLERPAGPVA